jgi:hypothetical protein
MSIRQETSFESPAIFEEPSRIERILTVLNLKLKLIFEKTLNLAS